VVNVVSTQLTVGDQINSRIIFRQSKFTVANAVTATAAAIHVLCDGTIFAANMPAFAFEVTRMTGRTERCVLRPWPGNAGTDSSAMAAVTAWIPAVIAGVVAVGVVAEIARCPGIGGMTGVALRIRE